MTGAPVVAVAAFLVALWFFLRLRSEQRKRRALEARLRERENTQNDSGWLAVLAHELRSPIAAILGYQELLQEGTFGELTPTAREAATRIGIAGEQLVSIIEGIDRLGGQDADFDEPVSDCDAHDLITRVIEQVAADAEARGVKLVTSETHAALRTRPEEAARALRLALGAAIKAGPDSTITVSAVNGDLPQIRIAGTRLQLDRDNAFTTADAARSGPALRLLLARYSARFAGGEILLLPGADGVTIRFNLPVISGSAASMASTDRGDAGDIGDQGG